mmetsp:Transcript_20393/g.39310  ORF Transcript_20393/g.39310 Transcript_20393/m.39310 type:complete len:96 (+) Transcript_20393:129-416(+)
MSKQRAENRLVRTAPPTPTMPAVYILFFRAMHAHAIGCVAELKTKNLASCAEVLLVSGEDGRHSCDHAKDAENDDEHVPHYLPTSDALGISEMFG